MEKGKVLSKGVGYGYAYNFGYDTEIVEKKDITLEEIITIVKKELDTAFNDTENLSDEEAMIFDAHSTLLEDEEFIGGIKKLVDEGLSLSQAIMDNGKKHAFVFLNMKDKSLSHIAEDIMDITYQMCDVLKESSTNMQIKEPVVLCCDNIYPSNLLNFISNYKVAAILTRDTSELSHSVVIARAAQIPFVTGLDFDIKNKMPVIVNTDENEVIFNPNYQKMMEIKKSPKKSASKLTELPLEVKLNAGNIDEVLKISKACNSNIGLFRSEYYYLKNTEMPTDEEISEYVDQLFFSFNDRAIDYRLPDFGRDKLPCYLENNNQLSGIEFLLEEKNILKQQINAIKHAGNLKNKRILLSYVNNRSYVDMIKKELAELNINVGAMIESKLDNDVLESIIEASDFINIGTNDLICDFSGNDRISYINTDKADIIRMFEYIKVIAELAHVSGVKVCICGEIAADEEYFEEIVKSGVDSVSVSAFHILNK